MRIGTFLRSGYVCAATSSLGTFERQFQGLSLKDSASVVNCAGLQEFLPRALDYLETGSNDAHSDDIADFLMGRRNEPPPGLDKPHPEIPADVQDILEELLGPKRPRRPGTHGAPESTLQILCFLEAQLSGPTHWAAPDVQADFPLSYALDSPPDTTALEQGPTAVPVTLEQRFQALPLEQRALVVNCAGLQEFLPRALDYLVAWGNRGHREDVAGFLMGARNDPPEGLDPPHSEIPADVQDILRGLLHTDRPRLPGTGEAPEPTIPALWALASQLPNLRQWAAPDVKARFPLAYQRDCPSDTTALEQPLTALPATLGARFQALAVPHIVSLMSCAGLQEFLPRALDYLATQGNGEHSDDVANFLMGQRNHLPKDLDTPHPEISAEVLNILEGLLRTDRSRLPGTGEASEPTIQALRALASQLDRLREPVAPDLAVDFPLSREPGSAPDVTAFERRLGNLSPMQRAMITHCEGLREFLPRATEFLATPKYSGHSEAVVHYLRGSGKALPDELPEPDPRISEDVKKVLKDLLRSREHGFFFWRGEAPQETCRKLEAIHLYIILGQLRDSLASQGIRKASVPWWDGSDTDAESNGE